MSRYSDHRPMRGIAPKGDHRRPRRLVAHDLGVSKFLCLTMGREPAAVALAIVSARDEEHFRTSPGGYFHGMVDKAKAAELHLERSVWALRRAAQPIPARHSRPGTGYDDR